MKFKNEIDAEFWYQRCGQNPPYTPFVTLRRIAAAIDDLSIATGHGEIVVTSFLRPDDRKSYHSKGQAIDIRVRDKSPRWFEAMMLLKFALQRLDPQVQMVMHLEEYNKENSHIHCEIDNGSL